MKNLHIALSQLCYIVPIILKLSKYFNLNLYFVINNHTTRSTINLIELSKLNNLNNLNNLNIKYNLFTVNQNEFNQLINNYVYLTNDIFLITSWANVFDNTLCYDVIYKPIHLSYSHGIDEELIINNGTHTNALSELMLNTALYNISYRDIITQIYNIDPNKKTIVFFETTSIWIFKKFSPSEHIMIRYQNEIINVLIDLSSKYNIILRSHPQEYYGYILSGTKHTSNNNINKYFDIDYTPIPVFNFYEIADIIITSRFSSSGYQALFINQKPVIILDTDFDNRRKYTSDEFVNRYSNKLIDDLILAGKIIGNNHTYVLNESSFSDIYSILDLIAISNISNNTLNLNRNKFLLDTYGVGTYTFDNLVTNNYLDKYLAQYL